MAVTDHHTTRQRLDRRAVASLDRVLWQRVELADGGPCGAVVAGTRRRRPASVRVDTDTAMALIEAGVPTVTRRVGTRS